MKLALISIALFLVMAADAFGQTRESTGKVDLPGEQGPIDILSDTKGFDMKPYLQELERRVKFKWYALVSDRAKSRTGQLSINFRIMKDGRINDLKYAAKSGVTILDEPAYQAILDSDPFQPLPNGFACQSISLSFRFYYNSFPTSPRKRLDDQVVPCVISTIKPVGPGRKIRTTSLYRPLNASAESHLQQFPIRVKVRSLFTRLRFDLLLRIDLTFGTNESNSVDS